MTFEELSIEGVLLVRGEVSSDARGAFTTLWESHGSAPGLAAFRPEGAHQAFNARASTLRGLHYQRPPHEQAKLVACAAGRLWDVVVDLRQESGSYLRWVGTELDARSGRALLVPRGCAHGYVTLEDATTVTYLIEGRYEPGASAVVRWNDPRFGIAWPVHPQALSDRDRTAPDFEA